MSRRFQSPQIRPLLSSDTRASKNTCIPSNTGEIQALPQSVLSLKKKRKAYDFETKQKVYEAVSIEKLKYSEVAALYGIRAKESVRNIVKKGPYIDMQGLKRQRRIPSILVRLEKMVFQNAVQIRNNNITLSRQVVK